MGNSIAIVSGRSFTGAAASLPTDTGNDEILTKGSLLLFDMAHSTAMDAGIGSVVPVQGQTPLLPNIAWRQAAAVLGLPMTQATQDSLRGVFVSNFLAGDMAFERTARLGLHGAVSQANQLAGRSTYLTQESISQYLISHPRNRIFIALEGMITRAGIQANGNDLPLLVIARSAAPTIDVEQTFTTGDNISSELGSRIEPGPNVEGAPFLRTGGSWRWRNTVPTSLADAQIQFALWGAFGAYSASGVNKCPSWVLYRVYVEDLTVSGRSYEDVDFLVRDIWRRNQGVGGRFAADLYTPPASLIA
jgi:hypothetical protein